VAIAFDAASENATAADPQNWTHTPTGTPRGVVVLIAHGTTSADIVTGVTYGGQAMFRWRTAFDSQGEVGRVYIYVLETGVPAGAQTVSIDRTEATTTVHGVATTWTATTTSIQVVDSDTLDGDGGNVADPSVLLNYLGRLCTSICIHYNGANAPSSLAELTGQSLVHDHDFGNFSSKVSRQTTPGTTDFTIGHTAVANPFALAAVAISEPLASGGQPPRTMHQMRLRRAA
jgi:hypothetical protein